MTCFLCSAAGVLGGFMLAGGLILVFDYLHGRTKK